ncbi:MAG: substrate-binding domain-containing protein [Chloroflexi bacterium]|nr:substrate-binding domain-containing protein [Chloroflexota bacterium]
MEKSASAYERHQTILRLVQEYSSVRVAQLAEYLNVSESTIRNDLEELGEQGQLVRIRGGAVAKVGHAPSNQISSYLAQKALENASEKEWIARWAAGMIEDGDVIMFDASSTVLHIAPFLADRRNLTVFTNGIDVARLLAKEPSNTIIILGGILRPNGNSITGSISEQLLQDYRIQTAFVSCSGFTTEMGFFEMDLQEAKMKTLMLQAAQKRIALLDSSKIGQVSLTRFASLEDMHYFITDEKISRETIEYVRSTNTHVVICSEQTTRSYMSTNGERRYFRVGFANLTENTPFSRDVRRSLEKAAEATKQIELIVADNQLDPQIALHVADELLAQDLDLVIEYQIDESIGNLIAHKFQQARIPMIAVDIPMVGARYFGVNNYVAGQIAGVELAKAIQTRWQGQFDFLIAVEQKRAGQLPALRIKGQLDGVQTALNISDILAPEKIIWVDSDNTSEGLYPVMDKTLRGLPSGSRCAVICFNDDAAIGTLRVASDIGCEGNLLIVGQGADRRIRAEMRKAQSSIIGSTAFRPEDYGPALTRLALDILEGNEAPLATYTEHFFVSPANVDEYYPAELEDAAF